MGTLLVDLETGGVRVRLDCSLHGPENLRAFPIGASATAIRRVAMSLAACAAVGLDMPHRRIREALGAIEWSIAGASRSAPAAQQPVIALAAYIDAVSNHLGGLAPTLEAAARLRLPAVAQGCNWWANSGLKICDDGLVRPDNDRQQTGGRIVPARARDALLAPDGTRWRYVSTLVWPREEPGVPTRILEAVVHVGLAGCVPSCEVHGLRMTSLRIPPPVVESWPFGTAMWYRDSARAMLDCLRDDAAAAAEAIRRLVKMA